VNKKEGMGNQKVVHSGPGKKGGMVFQGGDVTLGKKKRGMHIS